MAARVCVCIHRKGAPPHVRGTLALIGIPLAVSYVVDVAGPTVAAPPVLAMGDDKMENKTTTGIFLQEGSSGSRKRRMESRFQLSS